ncbi:UNVERIFIED_CONTAM: hypothetical protein Scaly_2837300 [Sesamum calycinum]|uniref:Zinc knuckle CX2CX4HX4C domain-containing protein n=1 Tax=Sesamum calycinum TaxID=2727403 RepID=A0AAW2IST0_9LAMI
MEANDDPNLVDLNFCDFHIYIHGLLLRKITKDCASHIGNKLGKVKDVELDSNGEVWRSSVCIRVAIDITKPLKRALKIRTVLGHDHLITFTYERLPNFYYFCGCLGHLSCQCELQLQESFQDPGANPPYGHWLRAVAPQSYRGCNGVSLSRDMVHSLRRLTFVLGSSLQFQPQPPLPHRGSSIFDNFGSSSIDSVRPSTPSAFNLHSVTPLPTCSPLVPIFANDLNLAPIPLIDPLCHILPDTTQTSPPPILLNPPPQSAATSKLENGSDGWRFTGIYGEPKQLRGLILGNFYPNYTVNLIGLALCPPFTWCNCHTSPSTLHERLDRACANVGWSQLFPITSVQHIPITCSDHVALLVRLVDIPKHDSRSTTVEI